MLKLAHDWNRVRNGYLVLDLLAQIDQAEAKHIFTRLMIRAALELAVVTFFAKRNPTIQVTEVNAATWRIGALRYLYLPIVDDEAVQTCATVLGWKHEGTVFVPSNQTHVLRCVFDADPRAHLWAVDDLDGFISWRTLAAQGDAQWDSADVMAFVCQTYNALARARDCDESTLIVIPPELQRQSSR